MLQGQRFLGCKEGLVDGASRRDFPKRALQKGSREKDCAF